MLPIEITSDDVKEKYLKKPVRPQEIHPKHSIGIINGLWANAMDKVVLFQFNANLFPTRGTFLDLKLTGMQGDVMKESMNVAKHLVIN